ncbi:MAG: hypothetical protein EZS28_019278 [Streblomastix strix]|uniref:Uncharacterized protein n=1 Tax=Streblomastix strix TaxID=222440 RepID=A0A5J4VSL8_9EUKA|nr:MAG: hypothetical protein EZS28_019278 [Streblomastix strix]
MDNQAQIIDWVTSNPYYKPKYLHALVNLSQISDKKDAKRDLALLHQRVDIFCLENIQKHYRYIIDPCNKAHGGNGVNRFSQPASLIHNSQPLPPVPVISWEDK